ncbi:hypothetical protein HR51_22780, partial [Burkholderia cepacia]
MKKLLFLSVTIATMTSQAYAFTCPSGTAKAVLTHDVVGAISLASFKEIDFKSPQSVQAALAKHTAQPIKGGTVVCAVAATDAGFFDYARKLIVPGRDVNLWVRADSD